jgi:hypothetical protein
MKHIHQTSVKYLTYLIHSKLCNITLVATKVHMILRNAVVLTWMCDKRELVWDVSLWNNIKSTLQ